MAFWRALDTKIAHRWEPSPLGKDYFFPACGRAVGSSSRISLDLAGTTGKRRCKLCERRFMQTR